MAYLDKKILLIISFIITLSAWSDISKLKIVDGFMIEEFVTEIDDARQMVEGERKICMKAIKKACLAFLHLAKQLHLTTSDKTTLVSSIKQAIHRKHICDCSCGIFLHDRDFVWHRLRPSVVELQ